VAGKIIENVNNQTPSALCRVVPDYLHILGSEGDLAVKSYD
jgi:hypothetical protein